MRANAHCAICFYLFFTLYIYYIINFLKNQFLILVKKIIHQNLSIDKCRLRIIKIFAHTIEKYHGFFIFPLRFIITSTSSQITTSRNFLITTSCRNLTTCLFIIRIFRSASRTTAHCPSRVSRNSNYLLLTIARCMVKTILRKRIVLHFLFFAECSSAKVLSFIFSFLLDKQLVKNNRATRRLAYAVEPLVRFELTTPALQERNSGQLSYNGKNTRRIKFNRKN